MTLMLLQQPMASDLRLVTASFRAISDLARIDEMAYETALLTEEIDLTVPKELADLLVSMADKAATMVRQAVVSFGNGDVADAEKVFEEDDALDALYEQVRVKVIEYLKNGTESARRRLSSFPSQSTSGAWATTHRASRIGPSSAQPVRRGSLARGE